MKNIFIYVLLFFIVLCVTCDDPPVESTDILRFIVNGLSVELTRGHRETNEIPVLTQNTDNNYYIISASDKDYDADSLPDEIVFIDNIAEVETKAVDQFDADFYHIEVPSGQYYTGSVNVVIDTFGDIYGYCTGTFSGTFEFPIGTGSQYVIEDGYFNVQRIDYDQFEPIYTEIITLLLLSK